jgi:ethanolamine ammonia-lyase large subunit
MINTIATKDLNAEVLNLLQGNINQDDYPHIKEMDVSEMRGITFLNLSGDITLEWSPENDEKMKGLVTKLMAAGYTFFTTRQVPIIKTNYKRKLGEKGIHSIKDLIISDETFDKIIQAIDQPEVAEFLKEGSVSFAKRIEARGKKEAIKRASDAEEVIKSKQALAVRPLTGG